MSDFINNLIYVGYSLQEYLWMTIGLIVFFGGGYLYSSWSIRRHQRKTEKKGEKQSHNKQDYI